MAPSSVRPLRWGIAGVSKGGFGLHAPLIRATTGAELVVAISRSGSSDTPGYGYIPIVSSVGECVRYGIDVLSIATPAGTHADLAHQAIDHGINVVVDKPFARTAAEALEVKSHALSKGVWIVPFHNRRWDGDFLTLKRLCNSGSLGRPYSFRSRIRRYFPSLPKWNVEGAHDSGGGTLLDLGPHLVDQALCLMGPAVSVTSVSRRVRPGYGAEDDCIILLRHANAGVSVLEASVSAATQGPRFQLDGDKGGVSIDGFDGQETDLLMGDGPDRAALDWGKAKMGQKAMLVTGDDRAHIELERGQWNGIYPAIVEAANGGNRFPVDVDSAISVARVIDACRVANEYGTWQELPG